MGFLDRLAHAWNAFKGTDPPNNYYANKHFVDIGPSFSYRPDRLVLRRGSEKSIVGAIYNRIAIDVSSLVFHHVKLDDNGRYKETINSDLENCLTVEANKDQTAKMFIRDAVMSVLEEGNIAIVPIDTTDNPDDTDSYDIETMRTAKIIQWYPDHVTVEVYNDRTGNMVNLTLKKSKVAIIENPLSAIMNEPNSTLQRLIHKLALSDLIDEKAGSTKLDLIIQLPYIVKTEVRRAQAEERRKEIETQLATSKYGIAYTDGSEHVTQLNRPVENNLSKSIEFLTSMLYGQLGITQGVLDGTADEKTMNNYYNRTVCPIADAIVDEMKRKFLTKTARSQHKTIMYFLNPFKLVTVSSIAEMADKFTRNEIMSTNEIRQIIGLKPVDSPAADELRNKNLNVPDGTGSPVPNVTKDTDSE